MAGNSTGNPIVSLKGLLHKIDTRRLKNFGNIDSRHLDRPFDPGNNYSIPYLWGSTGIIVNAAEINPARGHFMDGQFGDPQTG